MDKEIGKYRRRAKIAAAVDFLVFFLALGCSIAWLISSCPTKNTQPKGGRRTTNLSACHDVRNVSGLEWTHNRTKIGIGRFLHVVIPYREFATGEEILTYFVIDLVSSIPQMIIGMFLILTIATAQATLKGGGQPSTFEARVAGLYIVWNFVILLAFGIWRAIEGVWIGFSSGILIRGILIGVVTHLFLKLRQ